MNNNLDEWLDSLGVESTDTPATLLENPQPSNSPQSLSEEDIDDILEDYGFSQPETAQAEEIVEEQQEVERLEQDAIEAYQAVIDYNRDLDAEEDADWQEAIDSGGVVPVRGGLIEQMREAEEAAQEPRTLTLADIENALLEMTHNADIHIQQESPHTQQEPLIPLNSPTLLLDESTTRFSGAEWFSEIQKQDIIIGGVGGIGSNLVFQLSRMHPHSLFMYDDDSVEMVNMAGQLYSRSDIGKTKVAAMQDMISSYTNMQNVYAINAKFTENTEAGNVMMCGFDNMEARRIFFNAWRQHVMQLPSEERKNCLFLDGRLSIDTLQVFCLTGDDNMNAARYRDEFLFFDEEAEHTVCSMKQTTYLACMIGSFMVNLFTNWVANLLDPVIPYDLPFFTEYDAQNMIFKTVN